MNLYDFIKALTKLNTDQNYKKEILVAFAEQFEKIKTLNLSREQKQLTIFTTDIENDTETKTITDLQNFIRAYFVNIEDTKKYIINVFSKNKKEYNVIDVDTDIEELITIGVADEYWKTLYRRFFNWNRF